MCRATNDCRNRVECFFRQPAKAGAGHDSLDAGHRWRCHGRRPGTLFQHASPRVWRSRLTNLRQIAAAIGATVIATSSSAAKLDAASRLGATHVVNYRETPDWGNEVLRLTGGCGVDFVVDVVGPATLVQSLRATRRWGVVFVVGILSGDQPVEVLELIRKKGVAVQGIFMFSREHIEAAVGLYEEHALRPLVGRAFEYGEAKAAFEALVAQETLGKIVVRI